MVGLEEFNRAYERAAARAKEPQATAAHYDPCANRIVVHLSTGLEIAFAPHDTQGLAEATPAQLGAIEISPSGLGLYFPELDADLYLPALLEGFLGSARWAAARLGALGGVSRSAAKATAARINGKRDGRPRKLTA